MIRRRKNYFLAVAVMVGYVIGVGMFGLPYLVAKSGVLTFFIFLSFLGPVQYLMHLIYANIIVVTESYHRLPGYSAIYLGERGKKAVFFAKMTGNYCALLAYIIITGIFLHQLLSPYFGGSEFFYASILFAVEAAVVYFGIGMIARAELFMTGLLLLVVGLLVWKGCGAVEMSNYHLLDWRYILIPYGAMLFSMDGGGSLPIVARLLKRDREDIKSVVRIGTFLPIAVIIAFTLVVVGISGSRTTPDSLTGIKVILGDGVVFLSLIFGLLTMITSFFGVAESVKEVLNWDFKISRRLAWALAVFVPYAVYLLGVRNLTNVISFAGGIAGGTCGIVLILIFRRLREKEGGLVLFKRKPGAAVAYLLIGMFACGILYEIYYFLTQ